MSSGISRHLRTEPLSSLPPLLSRCPRADNSPKNRGIGSTRLAVFTTAGVPHGGFDTNREMFFFGRKATGFKRIIESLLGLWC